MKARNPKLSTGYFEILRRRRAVS